MRLWLKSLREKQALTQEQVAAKSGISRSYYTHIENGSKIPSVSVAKAISKTLKFKWTIFFESECHLEGQKTSA